MSGIYFGNELMETTKELKQLRELFKLLSDAFFCQQDQIARIIARIDALEAKSEIPHKVADEIEAAEVVAVNPDPPAYNPADPHSEPRRRRHVKAREFPVYLDHKKDAP